jgi:outer membrane protein TolC
VAGQDVPGQWWKAFGSSALDALVDDALANNADLQAAQAARARRAKAAAQGGALFPTVDLHFMPTRQKVADTLASPLADNSYIYNLHTAQLNIAYAPDIFGGTRRQIEAGRAQAEVQRLAQCHLPDPGLQCGAGGQRAAARALPGGREGRGAGRATAGTGPPAACAGRTGAG